MWFIIRAAFCVGIVFSMLPGPGATSEPGATPSLSSAFVPPAMRELADGALSFCKNDPKFCLDMAQRLAGLEGDIAPQAAKATSPETPRLVSDTLTATDRAVSPWRGNAKEPRPYGHLRAASRPTI